VREREKVRKKKKRDSVCERERKSKEKEEKRDSVCV